MVVYDLWLKLDDHHMQPAYGFGLFAYIAIMRTNCFQIGNTDNVRHPEIKANYG